MPLSEADTRAKLIDPALHASGWTEDLIRREETAGAIEIVSGIPRQRAKGRVDYTLRLKCSPTSQPVAVALIEAKAEHYPPTHGLQQGKVYASSKRLNVPFVYSSNGHQFVEYDSFTGLTHAPRPMSEFPSPDELRVRYEEGKGFKLDSDVAKPLLVPYARGEGQRRYYQDAAIRAVLEKVASGQNRALLSLATGSGKTFIAVNLLKRIANAGQLRRALFVCDRDELRRQALSAFQNEFGSDAAAATTGNPEKNARVVIATYQTLGVDTEEGDSSYLKTHYPQNYFSHVIIDECHRSAWGKWSEVLTRNPDAVQIGLTATPREFEYTEASSASQEDKKITADNLKYFGEPAYEYSIGQGIEDGYLAVMEIIRSDIFINRYEDTEAETGVEKRDLAGTTLRDALTGKELTIHEAAEKYTANTFESSLMIPARVKRMSKNLFDYLVASGEPEQKTIIFCARDRHADDVANEMNNLYARWCTDNGQTPVHGYAFKCTAAAGKEYLSEIRGSTRHHFIATTVDLLTTGVDVPPVTNIVFFKYVSSPIAFYQMVGRGTRLHAPTNKLMFKVYDYTNATRLFGEDFKTKFAEQEGRPSDVTWVGGEHQRAIEVQGLDVRVTTAGIYILTTDDSGETVPLTLEEYKQKLAARIVEEIPSLDEFREIWVEPDQRREMIGHLPDSGRSPLLVRTLSDMQDYDPYDVMADLAYGLAPRTMVDRADAFSYKNVRWLKAMSEEASEVIQAIASQFAKGGTDNLENPQIFQTPEVVQAGGAAALRQLGNPEEAYAETKLRMFKA